MSRTGSQILVPSGGTAAAVLSTFRLGDPALCGSIPYSPHISVDQWW